ncbi:MAG: VIT1/CCC1 transporter family protein [Parachlamydiaceae bacterium]|nr:VIT1/CCC1 transporter family protein [Parachlamydiaceae bacterium]
MCSEHFNGKEAISHIAEVQAKGLITSSEIHGTEVPGHQAAAADAARETAIALMLLWTLFLPFNLDFYETMALLSTFSLGWILWKFGRSAWLGWSRLERLHRILEQERWEIQHNRPQEREELRALYRSKGLEGKLLESVLDILMADDNRLLKVMVEEELGLSLESHEHPLKQAFGAFLGTLIAYSICMAGLLLWPSMGLPLAAILTTTAAGVLLAYEARNHLIAAAVWNFGIASVSFASVYFLILFSRVI